ncbi:unnamed protein product [Durusdinium trenchii]|uniref:Uncharacterized protein n=1 Tax=Durusdinium trenchii TaxID=1381693 RepID=A0ABP0IIK0_9DINO
MRCLIHLLIAGVFGDDASCSLQKPHVRSASLSLTSRASTATPDLWSTPSGFRQCPPVSAIQAGSPLPSVPASILPQKIQCSPGCTVIGNFVDDLYEFSCCCSGQLCQGCRRFSEGVCQECAAGYVMQKIPIMNISKCFICDDVPNWHDMHGRSCADLKHLHICSGSWPPQDQDLAYHGVRPSEACCACGGGNVYPTPSFMKLTVEALHFGQQIHSTPEPITSIAQEVEPGCAFAASGLQLLPDGRVKGVVNVPNNTVLECSTVSVQDPVRGIISSTEYSVPVFRFSYGQQVVNFKFYGLDQHPSPDRIPLQASTKDLTGFQKQCDPKCPWFKVDSTGDLLFVAEGAEGRKTFPQGLKSQVTDMPGMPSCSCYVRASQSKTEFVAAQVRLWRAGVWKVPKMVARVSAEMPEIPLIEDLGPGWQWYNGSGHDFQLPVVEELSTGKKFIVSEATPPDILDVSCRTPSTELTWSQTTGEVKLQGETAFRLDPVTGAISGTPLLSFLSAQGRGEVNVTCKVAIGGPLYDKVLPVATFNILIQDEVCWVPRHISSVTLVDDYPDHPDSSDMEEAKCIQICRARMDCAAARVWFSHCLIIASHLNNPRPDPDGGGMYLVRLNNCSEQTSELNITVPGAQYLQGTFSAMNVYHGEASYSRAGFNPERQLLLVRKANVQQAISDFCAESKWLLLHINSSDFEDGSLGSQNAPEFFGDPMACVNSDVVSHAFKDGTDDFNMRLLPNQIAEPDLDHIYQDVSQLQNATISLALPSCPKPENDDFVFGTVETPGIYTLQPCECFGAAHAAAAPVDEASDAAVPRNQDGYFNNGSVPDQLLFSGPYTCEENAAVRHISPSDYDGCQQACASDPECKFYLLGKTAQACTLFRHCNYIQDVGLEIENSLYGIPPKNSSFCRIANPEQCWQDVKRRSMLSLTPSDMPKCLFQEQFDACDALQLLLGKEDGACARCQYINTDQFGPSSSTSNTVSLGMSKVPLPETFLSASQVTISCSDTSRIFASHDDGLKWEGPRQTPVTFTCVSGVWIGEPGAWQDLSNFTCQRCLQVGSSNLQRLSLVSMPEVYFLEHRQVHITYPFATVGCSRAGALTAAPLLSLGAEMYINVVNAEDPRLTVSLTERETLWWIDTATERLRVKANVLDSSRQWCVCADPPLRPCWCPGSESSESSLKEGDSQFLVVERGLLKGPQEIQRKCVRVEQKDEDTRLTLADCPTKPDVEYLWYFQSGNCFFGFDITNTAQKLWSATSEASNASLLKLGNLAFSPQTGPVEGHFRIALYYDLGNLTLCLHADLNQPQGPGHAMVVSSDCRSFFAWQNERLAYFHLGNQTATYFVQMTTNNGSSVLFVADHLVPGATSQFDIFGSQGKFKPLDDLSKCLQAKKESFAPTQSYWGPRTRVIFPWGQLPYNPCYSVGSLEITIHRGYTADYAWQKCHTSPFLEKYGETTWHDVQEVSDFTPECPHPTILTEMVWPKESPNPDYSRKVNYSFGCTHVGSKYAQEDPEDVEHSVSPAAQILFFNCDDDALMSGIKFKKAETPMVYCRRYKTDINSDPAHETPVQFEDCSDIATQHWKIQTNDLPGVMELQSCKTSLSVVTDAINSFANPDADAKLLNLTIPNFDSFSAKEKESYTTAPAIHIVAANLDQILFSCLPGEATNVQVQGRSTLCASNAAVKVSDLCQARSIFRSQYQPQVVQKTCPVLMEESAQIEPSIAIDTASGGMTMGQLSEILRDQSYYTVPFGDPHDLPFNYTGNAADIDKVISVGFLSVQSGGGVWGLRCPPGAVVASDKSTLPYCLQIDAGAERVFYAFSGSISCPEGSAVSGWYNLPGFPVQAGSFGGPSNATGLRLFCRMTALLSSCQQATTSFCQEEGVVTSVSYDSNQFKLGCCRLQRRLGMSLTSSPRSTLKYESFAGYYCPIRIDITGAPIYKKTLIKSIGEPLLNTTRNEWTLNWNRFLNRWELREDQKLVEVLSGEAECPVAVNASGFSFSATYIEPLTAAYVIQPKPKPLLPQQKPEQPKLLTFHPEEPDYKEYCDPAYLQNPFAFQAADSISESNPCFHTFNAQPATLDPAPDAPLLKGITEQAFWQCGERSKRRSYMSSMTVANKAQLDKDVSDKQEQLEQITLGLELAAAIVGMIPWGSYAEPGSKGAEEMQKQVGAQQVGLLKNNLKKKARDLQKQAGKNIGKTFKQKVLDGMKNFLKSTANNLKNGWKWGKKMAGKDGWDLYKAAFKMDVPRRTSSYEDEKRPKPPTQGEFENMTAELIDQTVPQLSGSYAADLSALAEAGWKDCLPIQFGLSKVMCDLFCIEDAVTAGTSAVLESLQYSHSVLMTNIQSLLDYQTQYLLWAIGSVMDSKKVQQEPHEMLSASALLEDMRHLDLADMPNLGREILDWHQRAGNELLSRVAGMYINASTANWPHRIKLIKGMLQHYHSSLHERLREHRKLPASSAAQKQIKSKLQLLRDQASEHREIAHVVKSLRMQPFQPLTLDLNDQVVWTSVLESFLRNHEKHDAFIMLNLKALDQAEYAISLAHNFSQCAGADTAVLREAWQRAMQAEEKSSEALLDAWSASITTSERVEVAVKDQGFLDHLVQNVGLGEIAVDGVQCGNGTRRMQELYGRAVSTAVASLHPLAMSGSCCIGGSTTSRVDLLPHPVS